MISLHMIKLSHWPLLMYIGHVVCSRFDQNMKDIVYPA